MKLEDAVLLMECASLYYDFIKLADKHEMDHGYDDAVFSDLEDLMRLLIDACDEAEKEA